MEKDKQLLYSPIFLKYQADFEKNPRSRVFAPLAEIYRKIGMTDKAMEILSQGIRYHPAYVMGYMGLAFCYYDLKQFNLAYTTLRPFIEENRDNLRLQKLYADSCLALFKKDEALETLKYLLFVNPRDKEIATAVTVLEQELESSNAVIHKPIIIPEEVFSSSHLIEEVQDPIFLEEKLTSKPQEDYDDWQTVSLKPKEKLELVEPRNEWHQKSQIALTLETEEVSKIEVEKELEEEVATKNDSTPVVTHTLVDLYCGQGHLEKALEILDKILILNPKDQRTMAKKNEIMMLISPAQNIPEEVKNVEVKEKVSVSEAILELKLEKAVPNIIPDIITEPTEEEGRRQLMSLIDVHIPPELIVPDKKPKLSQIEKKYLRFLLKIQKRALDYQARL